jgi:DNA-directed RNA polymerase specialized sigma24 family protein
MKSETLPMNVPTSETGLARLARQGDAGAFAALFDSHKAAVYSLCRRSALSAHDAEQLTQDIFLDAFRSLVDCPKDRDLADHSRDKDDLSGTSFSAYLHSSAMNRIQMYERKMRLSAPFLDHLVELAIEPVGPHRVVFSDEQTQSRNNNRNNNDDESSPSLWSSWSSLIAKFVRPRQPAKALS